MTQPGEGDEAVESDRDSAASPREGDVAAVSRFIAAEREHRRAQQRALMAGDRVADLYAAVRAADRQAEAAQHTVLDLDAAEAAAGEWNEALAEQRDAVSRLAVDRQAAQGRGIKAWQARQRIELHAAARDRARASAAELAERTREASERVGTMDPAQWVRMREQATAALEQHPERRQALVDDAAARAPEAQLALSAARERERAAYAARERAAAEASDRGLDVGRLAEVAAIGSVPAAGCPSMDKRTEAALSAWQAEQDAAARERASAVLDNEQPGPSGGPQLER